MGKFVIKTTKTGVKFDLKAGNGEVIATSEVYTTEAACRSGIASVQKAAPAAAVEDQTVENFEAQKHPKFEVYTAVGEGYKAKASCLNGIESVKKNAPGASIVEADE